MKKCSTCSELKSLDCFCKNKTKKNGSSQCRVCVREGNRLYRQQNQAKIKERKKRYYAQNKEYVDKKNKQYYEQNPLLTKEYFRDYHQQNKERISKRAKVYRQKNQINISEQKKEHYRDNKEKILSRNTKWRNKNKYQVSKTNLKWQQENPIACNLRKRLNKVVKKGHKTGSAVRDLGCSIKFLMEHLRSLLQPGMTMEMLSTSKVHIDHIKPLAKFDLTDRKQLLEACHYTNLQPLWAKDNLSKGAK